MVLLSAPPNLTSDALTLFSTTDPALSDAPILIFYGPASSTASSTLASSRIQSHVFTPAGLQSYSRLAISPSSPLYRAVNCLSREEQGDEVCRALAYSLLKYFSELPEIVKEEWVKRSLSVDKPSTALKLFAEGHAAELASRMRPAPDSTEVANSVQSALTNQSLSYVDTDLILPAGSINAPSDSRDSADADETSDSTASKRYGPCAQLIQCFGETAFIPSARMRRAPSRATAINRSLVFSKSQKESLRREMCELVDTEERYVEKMHDLVNTVAADFRQEAKARPNNSSSPDEHALNSLFPPTLDRILSVNTGFRDACNQVLKDTEAAAIEDIERTSVNRSDSDLNDASGATAFAKCLLEWLPRFSDCYPDYMQAHSEFGTLLKGNTNRSPPSSFASRVQETGEQRLMSMLIEPIQRLPRYSLYLENIIKQLPVKHSALKAFLKAKDIIAEICAQDGSLDQCSKTLARLRQLIRSWPSTLQPRTRLITTIDMKELRPPYLILDSLADTTAYVGMLFADQIILVKKPSDHALSAHGLLAEIENTSISQPTSNASDHHSNSLVFVEAIPLQVTNVNEMSNGNLVRFMPSTRHSYTKSAAHKPAHAVRIFALAGAYEGRAVRLVKEIIKAKVEGRFKDDERDSWKWEARDYDGGQTGMGLFTAIFEDDMRRNESHPVARTRIVVNQSEMKSTHQPSEEGANVVASVKLEGDGFFRLEVSSTITQKTRDLVTSAEFLPVLAKRLSNVAQMHNSMRNPAVACYLLQHNEAILGSLKLTNDSRERSPSKPRGIRPHSPVKALASMFGGSSRHEVEQKSAPSASQLFAKAPSMRPKIGPKSTSDSRLPAVLEPSPPKVTLISKVEEKSAMDPIDALEKTLMNYVLALQARKGNVIGRVISNRAMADEAVVNELYNAIIDQPLNHELAAQSSIDVLFAAFEKFLKNAWRERLGPVIDISTLDDLQYNSSMLAPIEYEDYLLKVLNDLAPQNQRAFKATLGLLVDLLGAMTNDGDRGALMATVTEMLVCDGNPHDYMPLMDRFVEEHEVILSNGARSGNTTPYHGSMTSSSAARSTATGSFSSKASSFGKRLGFTSMSRENSKSSDSKMSSVLRTLSKTGRLGEPQNRGLLDRTKSVDFSARSSPLSRPGSRDRPTVLGAFEEPRPATGRSWDQLEPMESLKESGVVERANSHKKKRRSSLSEIEGLPLPNTSPFWGSPSPRRPEKSPLASRSGLVSRDVTPQLTPAGQGRIQPPTLLRPREGSPFTKAAGGFLPAPVTPMGSPTRSNAVRHKATERKENHLPSSPINPYTTNNLSSTPLQRANTTQPHHRRSPSQIPVPRGILSERPGSGNTPPPPLAPQTATSTTTTSPTKLPAPSPSPSPSKKLRMQTPQKLRNRLQTQQEAVGNAETGLQAELAKIGEELAALNLQSASPTKADASAASASAPALEPPVQQHQQRKSSATLQNLSGRLKALETKLPHLVGNLTRHTTMLEEEIAGALKVAEKKARETERRVAEVGKENEVLLRRSNEELARVFAAVSGGKDGDGVVELKKSLGESMKEGERWREEVGRLKRENAALLARCEGHGV